MCVCVCVLTVVDRVNAPLTLYLPILSQGFVMLCIDLHAPLSRHCVGASRACGQTSTQAGAQGNTWCGAVHGAAFWQAVGLSPV